MRKTQCNLGEGWSQISVSTQILGLDPTDVRSLSSGYFVESVLRLQQTCMATSEAAGTAPALSLERA